MAELHGALTNHDRLAALKAIKERISGNYGDPIVLGFYLLEERLLAALVLHLHAVLLRPNSNYEEVTQILHLIDVIIRLCPRHLQEQISLDLTTDFFDFTSSELLPPNRESRVPYLLSMLSILHSCSSTASGSQQILKSRVTLMRIISIMKNLEIADECLLQALNFVKNISFFGESHRLYLTSLHEFLSSLSSLTCRTTSESILERLSAIFRNLAITPECRKTLTGSAGVLRALIRMGTSSSHAVLRNTLKALICLAMDTESCITLLYHGDGQLISVIKRLVRLYHSHQCIRKRAIRLLRLLSQQKTFQLLAYDDDLVDLLSSVVNDDQCHEIRREAIEAFSHCMAMVQSNAPNYKSVLDIMVEWVDSRSVSPEIFACSIKEQACSTENGHVLAERTNIIDILSQIAANVDSSPAARYDACHALWLLAKTKENQVKLMASSFILSALVVNAANFRGAFEEIDESILPSCRECAVQTIVCLAQSHSNRRKMVAHDKLLQVLIQFAATTHDFAAKDQVKEVILWLVQEA